MCTTQKHSAPFSTSAAQIQHWPRHFVKRTSRGRRAGDKVAEKFKAGLGCQKVSRPSVVWRSAVRSVVRRKPETEAISRNPDSLRNIGEMSRYVTDSSSVSPRKHSSHHLALNWPVKPQTARQMGQMRSFDRLVFARTGPGSKRPIAHPEARRPIRTRTNRPRQT